MPYRERPRCASAARKATMATEELILRHATPRSSWLWSEDDYDVISEGKAVGRIFRPGAGAPQTEPWVWSIFFECRKLGRPYNGNAVDCECAMAEFAEAWRGQK